jgi:hypothetical protein
MIRKAYIIGTLVAGLTVAALQGGPSIGRLASSAHNFEHHFQNLKNGNSLNSVERFVFSLVMANTDRGTTKKIPRILSQN